MFLLRLIKLGQIIVNPSLFYALLRGTAAGVEHKFVLQNLSCECVVDVGANRGQFALISRKIFPQAMIHSFEPLEEPAKIFKRIFGNDPNVILYPYAIGSKKATATIHVTKDDDSSSLLPVIQSQSPVFPSVTEKETRQVVVLPLHLALGGILIPPTSLLKIDVQGFELEVLKGCENILNRFSYLYIECSFLELYRGQALAYEVVAWLAQRNFILSGVHNMYYQKNGTAVQGDFLFTKKNKRGKYEFRSSL